MTEQVQPRPEIVISAELDVNAQLALGGLDTVIHVDPEKAGELFQKLIDGVDIRKAGVHDEVTFANAVSSGLEASQGGRYLEFDETTEATIFTRAAKERAAALQRVSGDKLVEARLTHNLHRLLGYAGCVQAWQKENPPQQNAPSVA